MPSAQNQHALPLEASDLTPPGVFRGTKYSQRQLEQISVGAKRRPRAFTNRWYEAMFDEWEFYRQSYEGGQEFIHKHLWRHPQERDKNYLRRRDRAVQLNHIRVVVDTYAANLYRKPWARNLEDIPSPEQDTLGQFYQNIDRKGSSALDFFKSVFLRSAVFGVQAIVVDRFDGDGRDIQTYHDLKESGQRPYAYRVDPTDLIDWDLDEEGHLLWAMIREYHNPVRAFNEPDEGPEELFRLWTRDGWFLYRVEEVDEDKREKDAPKYRYILLDEGQHPCGRVPVVLCFVGQQIDDLPIGESLIKDLAPLVRQLTNKLSLIDEQIYQHVFNMLVVGESTYETLRATEWSVAGVLSMAEDDVKPFYLSPDIDQISAIRSEIREIELAIRFLSGLGRLNEGGNTYISGESLAFQTIDKRALLEALGRTMGETEQEVAQIALAWMGQDATLAPLAGFTVDLEPNEIEKVLTDGIRLQALGLLPNTEAYLENIIQGIHVHFSGNVDPARLKEMKDDAREKWEATADQLTNNMIENQKAGVTHTVAQVPVQNPGS